MATTIAGGSAVGDRRRRVSAGVEGPGVRARVLRLLARTLAKKAGGRSASVNRG